MTTDPATYYIRRFYQDGRPSKLIAEGLTLEEAQAHCQSEDTHGPGWFDGYDDASPVAQAEQALGDEAAREFVERVRELGI